MGVTVALSREELRRVDVVARVSSGQLTAVEAARLLGLSEPQVRRMVAAYRQEGGAALAHGNRGRKPVNAVPVETRLRVVELATTKYHGYNHQHLSEVLDQDQVHLSRSSVRRILVTAGLKGLLPNSVQA